MNPPGPVVPPAAAAPEDPVPDRVVVSVVLVPAVVSVVLVPAAVRAEAPVVSVVPVEGPAVVDPVVVVVPAVVPVGPVVPSVARDVAVATAMSCSPSTHRATPRARHRYRPGSWWWNERPLRRISAPS